MKRNPAPFAMIESGKKTIELRLLDEKRQKIQIGDLILFTNTDTGKALYETVGNGFIVEERLPPAIDLFESAALSTTVPPKMFTFSDFPEENNR